MSRLSCNCGEANFFHSCEMKSGSDLGTRQNMLPFRVLCATWTWASKAGDSVLCCCSFNDLPSTISGWQIIHGCSFMVTCRNTKKSAQPLLWQTYKVLHPRTYFHEPTYTVYILVHKARSYYLTIAHKVGRIWVPGTHCWHSIWWHTGSSNISSRNKAFVTPKDYLGTPHCADALEVLNGTICRDSGYLTVYWREKVDIHMLQSWMVLSHCGFWAHHDVWSAAAKNFCQGGSHMSFTDTADIHVSRKYHVSYSAKLLREKTFANFAVLWVFAKVFFVKFGGRHPLAWQKQGIRKSFSVKIVLFTNLQKFSPSKVSRYTVWAPSLTEG